MDNDEFVILLERLETDDEVTGYRVLQISNMFISMINMHIKVKSIAMHICASIVIRLNGSKLINTDMVIHEAEIAMCLTKEKGGSSAVIFDGKTIPVSTRELNQYDNQRMNICS